MFRWLSTNIPRLTSDPQWVLSWLMFCLSSSAIATPINRQTSNNTKLPYVDEVSIKALSAKGWSVHPQPEGRVVQAIHIISLPVFLKGERLSTLTQPLNYLHMTTKREVIERESRLSIGSLWSAPRALETERNLRTLGVFTSARVIPVMKTQISERKITKDHLRGESDTQAPLEVIIVTRDLWSLRVESGFSYNGGVLNQLNLSLTERNLLGQRILLSAVSAVSPYNIIGGLVVNHRRFGPDLSLNASVSSAWTRGSGEREGESAQLSLSRPLFNLDQAWSMGASLGAGRQRSRIGVAGEVLTDDDPSTVEVEETPLEWELKSWSAGLQATRQWSGPTQKSLSLGLGVSHSQRQVFEGVSASQEQRWRSLYLPPDRFQLGPSLSFSWYQRQYIALTDVSTFGVREDLRVGPRFSTGHQLVLVGDKAYLPSLSLSYTYPFLSRGFVSTSIGGSARIEGQNSDEVVNRRLSAGLSSAIPLRLMGSHRGYFIIRLTLSERWRDVSNSVITIGGDAGLRGYPNGAFRVIGGGVSRNNFEYRSPPIRWSFIHLGVAIFYEGGSVHKDLTQYQWRHSVGGGLRLLFPQLNRSVFRIDLARPLSLFPDGLNTPPIVLSVGSAQGFWFMPWES